MSDEIAALITLRGKTHGNFNDVSSVAQSLKSTMRSSRMWHKMSRARQEALDAMATKIARILSGDDTFDDHWVDLEGYASLGRQAPR